MASNHLGPVPVEAELTDGWVTLTPPVPAAIEFARRPVTLAARRVNARYRVVSGSIARHFSGLGCMRVTAPLADGCLDAVRAAGHRVAVDDRRTKTAEFDPVAVPGVDAASHALLAAVAGSRRGQFAVRPAELVGAVADVRRAFPKPVMLVVVPTLAAVRQLRRALPRALGEPVGWALSTRTWHPRRRVVVSTPLSLARHVFDGPRVVVLVEPHRMTGTACHVPFWHLNDCAVRLYGFAPPGREADPLADAWVDAFCGPIEPAGARPVGVRFVKSGGGRVKHADDPLARKRAAYWSNADRNRRVARVALDAANDTTGPVRPAVAVVAANTEQLGHLARALPGWATRDRRPGADTGTIPAGANAVVTARWAADRGVDADVVVFAAGGPDRLPGRFSKPPGDGTPPLVVDLDDRFDDDARRDADTRARRYETRGWSVTRVTNQSR